MMKNKMRANLRMKRRRRKKRKKSQKLLKNRRNEILIKINRFKFLNVVVPKEPNK